MEELLAQLLQQRALQVKAESDQRHGQILAQLAQPVNAVTRVHPQDRMPILQRADNLGRAIQSNDISALDERGLDVPAYMYNGLTPNDIIEAHGIGGQMRGFGGEPQLKSAHPGFKDPTVQFPVDTSNAFVGGRETGEYGDTKQAKRQAGAKAVDSYVQERGYDAALFDGMSAQEAARRIADQLQAQRERMGDMGAWSVLNQF